MKTEETKYWESRFPTREPKKDDVSLVMLEALKEAKLQIEYLHEKSYITGSGCAVISRIEHAIALAEGK